MSEKSWPQSALTKVWVVWQNGFKKTLHSYDTSGRYEVADPRRYGVEGLRRRLRENEVKYKSPVKEAKLYDNQTGAELEVWVQNGRWL